MRGVYLSLVAAVLLSATPVAAKDEVQRFDNGPFLWIPEQFFDLSADILNSPANDVRRQRAIAFVARLAGSREEALRYPAGQSSDELARGYMISIDGYLSASSKQALANKFLADDRMREFGRALLQDNWQLPDGSLVSLAPGQSVTNHLGGIFLTGNELLRRSDGELPPGNFRASVKGACPITDGPVQLVRDRFLIEMRRGDSLLFWGAVGAAHAWFIPSESKYLKITVRSRKKDMLVEFPDRVGELFRAALTGDDLEFEGEFHGKCRIRLERVSGGAGPGFDGTTSRLSRLPDEELVERKSTPGVRFLMREADRTLDQNGQPEVHYRLEASGFPPDKSYSLWAYFTYREPVRLVSRLGVDTNGVMLVEEFSPDRPIDWLPAPLETTVPLTLHDMAPGEAFEYGIVSEDGTVAAYVTVYPFPLEASSGPCHLQLQPWFPGGKVFAMRASGLTPDATVTIESRADDTLLTREQRVAADGTLFAHVFPEVAGKTRGRASLRLEGGGCSVRLDYDWGGR